MSAVLAALLGAACLAPGAGAATASSPLTGLTAAGRQLGALAGEARSAATRRRVIAARGELERATARPLWIDSGHVLAPVHGQLVFAHSRAALRGLEHAPAGSLPPARLTGVEGEILAADRGLAGGAILQALGGPGGLLIRARGMILSGDRWAATSRLDLAAEQYGASWRAAFHALNQLVRVRTAFVSPRLLASGARRALVGGPRTRPAGVHRVAGPGGRERSGKPEVLFVGVESCPACAIERWGMVVALTRFGTFSNLRLGQSAVTEQPFVRSFTFAGARYASQYVTFDPVELSSDLPGAAGGFQVLGRLGPDQRRLLGRLDPSGIVPFIDVATRFADVGATVSPTLAQGLSWTQLATSVSRPRTLPGRAIAATAEVLTAEICRTTGGAPASVCSSAVVGDYTSRLARFGGRATGCPIGGGAAGQPAAGGTPRSRLATRRRR